jgi:ribosome-binding factor A
MKGDRKEKILEQIRRLAGEFIQEQSDGKALITVTRVLGEDNLRNATVFVTILPQNAEESALNFLKRKRAGLRKHVRENSRFKNLPFFDFAIDEGEKNRQHIDEISNKD